jgi:hypothetical protein
VVSSLVEADRRDRRAWTLGTCRLKGLGFPISDVGSGYQVLFDRNVPVRQSGQKTSKKSQ